MTIFTIDSDDHIAATPGDRKPEAADHFSSPDELGQVTPGKFITFFYALVDGRSRRISYANAGHNPPFL